MVRKFPLRCALYLFIGLFSGSLVLPQAAAGAMSDEPSSRSRIQMINSLARAGRADAQYTLARLYLSGQGQGLDRDTDKGLHWLQKAAEQDHAASQNQLGLVYTGGYGICIDCRLASQWFERIPRPNKLYLQAQGNLAWILATCPDHDFRDGQRALDIIQGLIEIDAHNNPLLLDTLAAAYAETGQFQRAIDTQQQALRALDPAEASQQQRQRFTARLHSYQKNRPWRLATNRQQDNPPLN